MKVRESQTTLSEQRVDHSSALPKSAQIRRATAADVHGIADVHVASWKTAYRGILPDGVLDELSVEQRAQRWTEILARGESTTVVAEDQSGIVGFASLGTSRDADADPGRVAEILAVYVSPSCWGRGFGTRLCEAALAELAADGFSEVTLWVLQRNERAIRFYRGLGFGPDGASQEKTIGTAQQVIRLRKPLDASSSRSDGQRTTNDGQ